MSLGGADEGADEGAVVSAEDHMFFVKTTGKKYYLQCASAQNLGSWVCALNTAIRQVNGTPHKEQSYTERVSAQSKLMSIKIDPGEVGEEIGMTLSYGVSKTGQATKALQADHPLNTVVVTKLYTSSTSGGGSDPIDRVSPAYLDSRAGKAGVKVGDELLSLNGEALTASNTMKLFKELSISGGTLNLVVRRCSGGAGAAGTAHALHQEAMQKAREWRVSSNAQGTAL
jgi:hypothetical protein